jgi:hypothetical protein
MATRRSLWSSVKRRGTNFAATQCISNFSVRMAWHDSTDMLHSSAISRTVKRRLERTTARTWATWTASLHVEGRPGRGSVSWLPTVLETSEPFITLCTAHTLVTVSFFQHFMSLGKCFPKLNTKLNVYALFVKFWHVKIRRQHFAHSQTNCSSTMTKQDRTTRLAADNSRTSQLGCATFRKAKRFCIGALF